MRVINLKQGTDSWLEFREDKASGSVMSQAISNKKETRLGLIKKMLARKYSTYADTGYKSESMERGNDEEKFASKEYEARFDCKLEVVGACQHDTLDWLMFSPDRFKNGRKTYVEIKSPDSNTMIGYMLDGKMPSAYMPQILTSFIVNEIQEDAELVIYDPRFHEHNHRMLVIRVTREELREEIDSMMKALCRFREEWEEADQIIKNKIF
jgi:hypothetical protein